LTEALSLISREFRTDWILARGSEVNWFYAFVMSLIAMTYIAPP